MLVLSRRPNQKIVIAENIVVTVVEIRGNTVRLGFDAPPHVPVHLEEIWARIQAEGSAPPDTSSNE